MTTPEPSVSGRRALVAVRQAVRRGLADVTSGPVLVAGSGGPDSTALLAATVAEARRRSRAAALGRDRSAPGAGAYRVVAVTVDHGLQPGSAGRAQQVAARMTAAGADEARVATVSVTAHGVGPEAAARRARYAALTEAAEECGAPVVLLGHTRDDQAETVLLGLTRGSGARALAGMPRRSGAYRRPMLELTRTETVAACAAEGLAVWHDPHNEDERFLRTAVRHRLLPSLEQELGSGVAASLARTADQLRVDQEALDGYADAAARRAREAAGWPADAPGAGTAPAASPEAAGGWDAATLAAEPRAVLTRVVRHAAVRAGATDGELAAVHVTALAELVTAEVRGEVQLPGWVTGYLRHGVLRFRVTVPPGP